MPPVITISFQGVIHTHMTGDPNMDTYCGMDADDSELELVQVENPPNAKVTCDICHRMWREAYKWKASDFAL